MLILRSLVVFLLALAAQFGDSANADEPHPQPATPNAVLAQRVLDPARHHLGTPGDPEWSDFANDRAEGRTWQVRFSAEPNTDEATLFIRQRDVKLDWDVRLNGRTIGKLVTNEADLVHTLKVPSGALRKGENELAIGPPSGRDDIVVGPCSLVFEPRALAVNKATLDVRVTDGQEKLPCRITVVDENGALAALFTTPDPHLAARAGVVYTSNGQARIGVRPGRYTVYATRGFEYGMAQRSVTIASGQTLDVPLSITREVPTPSLAACDTHVHTLTHSGHGDASVEERLVTLAGEGIEVPIATDHNHLTDYRDASARLGVQERFTPVIGDEVTTRKGHFNAFPFAPTESAPDASIEDWPKLLRGIRDGNESRVIVLNHPRDLHGTFRPFDPANFNSATGDLRPGTGFDAVELFNSGAMQSDPTRVLRDWFALWNHGHLITAVGASDSHDVSRYIVGQARTYVACDDSQPGRIDIVEVSHSLRDGRALVSLGLLARLSVNDQFEAGSLATPLGSELRVSVTVLGPSWTRADRVELFANGIKIREARIEDDGRAGQKARFDWTMPRPSQDVALVAVASGPGVTAPYWPIPRPYQPTSKDWQPRVFGITNPIRVDADGDGQWFSPRYYAQFAIELAGTEPSSLFRFLARFDEAVATQAAALCHPSGTGERGEEFAKALKSAPEVVRRGFAAYEQSLAPGTAER